MKDEKLNIWCVIPVYNNSATVKNVAMECRSIMKQVLVIDDASTDLESDFFTALETADIHYIRHERNQGKGGAMLTAIRYLSDLNADYLIGIDADGQHYPADLVKFLDVLHQSESKNGEADLLLAGYRDFNTPNVPGSSRFGRKFSNFWVKLETGVSFSDTQCGFRAYPVRAISKLNFICHGFGFDVEVLTRAIWGGLKLQEIPVKVTYAPRGEHLTHFRPFTDNFKMSMLHTHLVGLRLLPFKPRQIVKNTTSKDLSIFRSPRMFFKHLLQENTTPPLLATSAAVGTFLAILPIPGFHMLLILYVCLRMKLNKIMALAIQNLFMPPFTPFLCIELGYFMRHGQFLTELSMQTVVYEMHHRLLEWLLGSLFIAPLFAAIAWLVVFGVANHLQCSPKEEPIQNG
ncbi:MAG: DUF2062 domain-containing protein [Victivallaceae bacterium]|nr:DUF2062 domain-containing protein [Victivallaceae bacterium]